MRKGFTLLELSVVLVIIAVITGMSISSGVSVIASARQSATTKKMQTIDAALLVYRGAWGRIPCPADLTAGPGGSNYGIEAANPGSCTGGSPAANFSAAGVTNTFATAAEGAVPVATLGLPGDLMYDGWGNRFRYVVDVAMTAPNAFMNTPLGCNIGPVTVNDANGNARTTAATYALISHGANGHGAYTPNGVTVNSGSVNANELVNCHCTSSAAPSTYSPVYVQMNPSVDTSNALDNFDDVVFFKERWQIVTSWDIPGNCPYIAATDPGNYRVNIFHLNGTYANSLGAGYNGVTGTPGSSGTGNGQFQWPQDVTIDASGNFWVVDNNPAMRVQEFGPSGSYMATLGGPGFGNGQFYYPTGLAVDAQSNIWVADAGNNRVEKFNSSGTWLSTIPPSCANASVPACPASASNGKFNGPQNVTVDGAGNIWVTDSGNVRAQKFSSAGSRLLTIPPSGSFGCQTSSTPACPNDFTNNPFTYASKIAFDAAGNLWTGDAYGQINEASSVTGIITHIFSGYYVSSVAFDSNGYLWGGVVGNYLQKFNGSGALVATYGSQGTANGQFGNTYKPISVGVTQSR